MPKARNGGEQRGRSFHPIVRGSPRDFFPILSASMLVFNGIYCAWD